MAVEAERKRLRPLKEQEGGKRRNGSALISQQNGADVGDKCGRTGGFRKGNAVIARIRRRNLRVTAARLPVKAAGIDDDAAQRRSVAADEFRGRMYDDVCAVLDGTDPIRRAERIVDDDGKTMPVGSRCDGVDIRDVAVRVAKRFQIDRFCFRADGVFDFGKVMRVDKRRLYAE